MDAKETIEHIKLEDELSICPACGYSDGFHVSFKKAAGPGGWNVILICPQCHRKYAAAWHIQLDSAD
jgi:DNA-directed RNA polymerase subunit M/transcription elongation factor TFIIS